MIRTICNSWFCGSWFARTFGMKFEICPKTRMRCIKADCARAKRLIRTSHPAGFCMDGLKVQALNGWILNERPNPTHWIYRVSAGPECCCSVLEELSYRLRFSHTQPRPNHTPFLRVGWSPAAIAAAFAPERAGYPYIKGKNKKNNKNPISTFRPNSFHIYLINPLGPFYPNVLLKGGEGTKGE